MSIFANCTGLVGNIEGHFINVAAKYRSFVKNKK